MSFNSATQIPVCYRKAVYRDGQQIPLPLAPESIISTGRIEKKV
jgi:hypothetical protein